MKRLTIVFLVLSAFLAAPLSADIAYSSFTSPGPSPTGYNLSGSNTIGGYTPGYGPGWWAEAVQFIPTISGNVESYQVALYQGPGGSSGVVDFELFSTDPTTLGNPLTAVGIDATAVSVTDPTPAVYTLSSTLNPLLSAGQTYWLVATIPGGNASVDVEWNYNTNGPGGGPAYESPDGTYPHNPSTGWYATGTNDGVLQVNTPDGGMTLMLLGGALFGLETLRRRFRA
jgi:hypothetical protein